MIRKLSKDKNYSLYDFDKDIWSSVNVFNNSNILYSLSLQSKIMRDWIHPNHFFTYRATLKMLNKLYSHYFYPKGGKVNEIYSTFPPNLDFKVLKSIRKHKYFLTHVSLLDGKRYRWLITNLKDTFNIMHYSHGDVMIVTDKLLQTIPLKGIFPNIFEKGLKYCIYTTSNKSFLIRNEKNIMIHQLKNISVCNSMKISINNTFYNFENHWLDEIGIDNPYE